MSSRQFLDLPLELIHKILTPLSPKELATCQLINKHLNVIISESVILQYNIALTLAKADDNPCSVAPMRHKLEDIRSSEASWSNLQPKFIATLPVKHRTSGIYDLSAGTFLLGNGDRMALQYLQLPTQLDDPLDWKRISVGKTIIDMGFCVFEHDLIAIITSTPNPIQIGLLDIEMELLEYSTGRPHPRAKDSTIFIMTSSTRPSLMCEIVGENLVLILHFTNIMLGHRIFIWNWCTNVLKNAFLAPCHSYSGIIFLKEDLIILPNAKSAAFEFFRIPKQATADALKPIFSLKLPPLVDGMEIHSISCRAEPNPIVDVSRLNKRRRAQERADAGMDDMDHFAAKRGFLASAEDAICIFQLRCRNTVIVFQAGVNVHFETTGGSYTLIVHRSSFLEMARRYEEISNVSNDPPQIAWVDWGPPVSRWFNANTTCTRWITTSAGQRCAIIDIDAYGSPITILDFNPFNIGKIKAKLTRENETIKEKLHQENDEMSNQKLRSVAVTEGVDQHQSVLSQETEMGNLADEDRETANMSEASEMVIVEDDDHGSWTTDDDDDDVLGDADSVNSMPGLDALTDSDESSFGYTTNRQPGCALCTVFEDPSTLRSPETFTEEVEGRLPYIEYVSERDYGYDGVLLDEERIIGITTDENRGISVLDVFYFG